ncbi:hypothetical protein WA171_003173, partial [Blastocystis sp. BT1]
MGCTFSSDTLRSQLRPPKPWKMDFTKYDRQLNENDLDDLRLKFWDDCVTNNLEIWQVLRKCCEACLKADYETANEIFVEANLQTVNHDLSEVIDSEGQVYSIEKYCYSNPSNLMVGHIEEETSVVAASRMTYHFRLQTTLMEEQKQFELVLSPQATITSIITSIKEMMKEKHEVETVNCVKLIYRGFVMEPE